MPILFDDCFSFVKLIFREFFSLVDFNHGFDIYFEDT